MDKSIKIERVKKGDTEVSIRIRAQETIKQRLTENKDKAGFKSLSQFLIFRGLEEVPPRKAPSKERLSLIKHLARSGNAYTKIDALYAILSKDTSANPDILVELKAIRVDINTVANAIHDTLGHDSQE